MCSATVIQALKDLKGVKGTEGRAKITQQCGSWFYDIHHRAEWLDGVDPNGSMVTRVRGALSPSAFPIKITPSTNIPAIGARPADIFGARIDDHRCPMVKGTA